MGLKYRGPDAVNADDIVALGQGDTRWAAKTDLGGLTFVTSSTPPAAGTPTTTITFVS